MRGRAVSENRKSQNAVAAGFSRARDSMAASWRIGGRNPSSGSWYGASSNGKRDAATKATSAFPVSGADVRDQLKYIRLEKKLRKSLDVISSVYLSHQARKEADRIKLLEKKAMVLDEDVAFIHKVNEHEATMENKLKQQ